MKLRAKVREITGNTRQAVGIVKDNKVYAHDVPTIVWVEITDDESGYYLLMHDEANLCVADGWYESLEETKRQAEFQFAILESDWIEVK